MENTKRPELTPLDKGKTFKTMRVTAKAGMVMPPHHTTMEAVIIVEEGEGVLKMPNGNHVLKQGASFIIPPGVNHSLEIKKDFKATVIMALDAEIQFQD